jgi:hypothetical protein
MAGNIDDEFGSSVQSPPPPPPPSPAAPSPVAIVFPSKSGDQLTQVDVSKILRSELKSGRKVLFEEDKEGDWVKFFFETV